MQRQTADERRRLDLVTPPVAARLGPRSGRVGRGARVPHLNIADWHRAVGDRKLDGGRAVTRVSEQWHRTLRSSARMLPCVVARAAPRSRQRQSGGSGQRKKFVDGTREEQDEHFGASQKPGSRRSPLPTSRNVSQLLRRLERLTVPGRSEGGGCSCRSRRLRHHAATLAKEFHSGIKAVSSQR